MTEASVITGSMVLLLRDHISAAYWSAPRLYHWAGAALVAIVLIQSGAVPMPRAASFTELALLVLIAAPLFAVLSVSMFILLHFRLSPAQRQVRYEIDAEKIVTRDATGAAIVLPWDQVLSARERDAGFVIKVRPAGVRWFAKRAFTPEAVAAMRNLMREKLRGEARLES